MTVQLISQRSLGEGGFDYLKAVMECLNEVHSPEHRAATAGTPVEDMRKLDEEVIESTRETYNSAPDQAAEEAIAMQIIRLFDFAMQALDMSVRFLDEDGNVTEDSSKFHTIQVWGEPID